VTNAQIKVSPEKTVNSFDRPICMNGTSCALSNLLYTSLEEFQERNNGWTLSRILNLTVNMNIHNPLHAGYNIELSQEIKLKMINVQSIWTMHVSRSPVVAALHLAKSNVDQKSLCITQSFITQQC